MGKCLPCPWHFVAMSHLLSKDVRGQIAQNKNETLGKWFCLLHHLWLHNFSVPALRAVQWRLCKAFLPPCYLVCFFRELARCEQAAASIPCGGKGINQSWAVALLCKKKKKERKKEVLRVQMNQVQRQSKQNLKLHLEKSNIRNIFINSSLGDGVMPEESKHCD